MMLSEAFCDDGTSFWHDSWGGYERHNEGSNFTYMDGHVKWLPGSKVDDAMFSPADH